MKKLLLFITVLLSVSSFAGEHVRGIVCAYAESHDQAVRKLNGMLNDKNSNLAIKSDVYRRNDRTVKSSAYTPLSTIQSISAPVFGKVPRQFESFGKDYSACITVQGYRKF